MPSKQPGLVGLTLNFFEQINVKAGDWGTPTKRHFEKLMECPPGRKVGNVAVTLPMRVLACVLKASYCNLPGAAGVEHSQEITVRDQDTGKNKRERVLIRENPMLRKLALMHQGVVAVVKPEKSDRYIPLTTAHITGQLNRSVKEPFKRARQPLSDAEAAQLEVDLAEVRRAVKQIEDLGFGVRVHVDHGRPLQDDPKERHKLRGKTAIVVYARPKEGTGEFSTCRQVCLLGESVTDSSDSQFPDSAHRDFAPRQMMLDLGFPAEKAEAYAGRPEIRKQLELIQARRRRALEAEARVKAAEEQLRAEVLRLEGQAPQEAAAAPPPRVTPAPKPDDATRPIPTQEQANSSDVAAALEPFRPGGGADDGHTAELLRESRVMTAEEFHRQLVKSFADAGLGTPTRSQTRPVYDQVAGEAHRFANAITPHLLRQRRAKTPGMLTYFVEEFHDGRLVAAQKEEPAKKSAPAACPNCGGSGIYGVDWDTINDAVEAISSGAQYCSCADAAMARDLVEPELTRRAAQ